MPQPTPSSSNRLRLPLIAVSIVCVIEAIAIAFLLGRDATARPALALTQTTSPPPPSSSTPTPAPESPSPSPAVARGKVGQRVDSGGIAMTLVTVSNEPRFKELFTPRPSEKFVDVELLIENTSPRGFGYYSNQFTLKDAKDRPFSSTALGAGEPALGWGTIVPSAKVRGHLAFVVPRDATGLTLTYPVSDAPADPRSIQIELGQ
jgi:hypothetical protein